MSDYYTFSESYSGKYVMNRVKERKQIVKLVTPKWRLGWQLVGENRALDQYSTARTK